jgi:hypothetical protein
MLEALSNPGLAVLFKLVLSNLKSTSTHFSFLSNNFIAHSTLPKNLP